MLLCLAALEIVGALALRAGAEETLKKQARVGLGRDRLSRRAPGEIVLIGTGIA